MKCPNIAILLFLLFLPADLFSQNYTQKSNFLHTIAEAEKKLKHEDFEVRRFRDSRFEGDITKRVILHFQDGVYIQVKWKHAPRGGQEFNNEPRYELAAYEFQKLFLDEAEYVVPPTTIRGLPNSLYKTIEKQAPETFTNSDMVFFCLQYWLENVEAEDIVDKERLKTDIEYEKHVGNLNIFSYLVRHSDTNKGNFLISTIPDKPRVFAVDNGVAFESEKSNRGDEWSKLLVKRLPAQTVARLKHLTSEIIEQKLETVAQFEINYNLAIPVAPTENLAASKGVRRSNNTIQFGLTTREIDGIYSRLEKLLKRIDEGKIEVF